MFAAANDEYVYNPKVIETLLAHGADVKHRDDDGRTALHYSCQKIDDLDTFLMLIKAGADVNIQDNDGWTALFWIARNSEIRDDEAAEIVDALIFAGADIYIQDESEYGKTAMDAAVKYKVHKLLWEVI